MRVDKAVREKKKHARKNRRIAWLALSFSVTISDKTGPIRHTCYLDLKAAGLEMTDK